MLSRMAESLYWIGRYVERAEQTARLTEVTFRHTLVMGSTREAETRRHRHWAALLDIVGERPAFATRRSTRRAERARASDLLVGQQETRSWSA